MGENKEGTLTAYAIDRADGKLKLLNTVRSGGAGPTHVSVHPSGRFVLTANYFGGSVAVLPILDDGRLGDATDIKNRRRQGRPDQGDPRPGGELRRQRPRPHPRPHDRARPFRTVRIARGPGPGQDLRLEIRREEGEADRERLAQRSNYRPETGRGNSASTPKAVGSIPIQEEGSTARLF